MSCDVCGREDREIEGVYALPTVPASLGFCRECLDNDAMPPGLLSRWQEGAEMLKHFTMYHPDRGYVKVLESED